MRGLGELLAELAALDVRLWVEGKSLRCSAPTGALGESLREELRARRGELLSYLGRETGVGCGDGDAGLVRVERSGTVPLSFAQERLWFFDRLMPGHPYYNEPVALRLRGLLDVRALERSLREVVRRHESLRTVFREVGGELGQVIEAEVGLDLWVLDLEGVLAGADRDVLREVLEKEARRRFDLELGPLVRAGLVRLGVGEQVLLLTMHHIVSDGWSFGVLVGEVARLYESYGRGEAASLPELSIQYADYAVWQRRRLVGKVWDREVSYWKEQLSGVPALELSLGGRRPARERFCGGSEGFEVGAGVTGRLRELSRRSGATLFVTLLAAFKVLLHRYTGQTDVVVGSVIANRNRRELEGLIGFFVNTLVLRTDLSGDPSFGELLGRVREVCLGAYGHQDLPFEKLVEELRPGRGVSGSPLFQVLFVLQNAPLSLELPGLWVEPVEVETGTAKFDLSLHLSEGRSGLRGCIEYSRDLFSGETIRRMATHYQVLLEGIGADPDRRISELSLLGEEERRRLVVEWNATGRRYPESVCVHEMLARRVVDWWDRVAVSCGEEQLTYGELHQRAERLADRLRVAGVGLEDRVGLYVERGLGLVVGMLGILKVGGAYVPLDPAYPGERLGWMLEDSGAVALVVPGRLSGKVPAGGARVIRLEEGGEDGESAGVQDPRPTTQPENLAYVIYTSGSTGRPKGISVSHRAILRLVMNSNYVILDSSERIAQVSNASFDAATFEIWGALLHGARLIYVSRETSLSPERFVAQIRNDGIRTAFLTTGLFHELARQVPSGLDSVDNLLFGGEVADARLVRAVRRSVPPRRLIHVYGPTESTTFSSWLLVGELPDEATTVPIGHPIANTRIYLLDRYMGPVPVGVAGELYIGGDGLARGYQGRADLTAERFLPDPFGAGLRLYRTGDRGRYRDDGCIEFLGRLDDQVKIRGYRVELGEVEAVLCGHGGVREGVVACREYGEGGRRLVAYVVPRSGGVVDAGELRRYLGGKLPEYMVPSEYVVLDGLPLNENGKVDRSRLPEPERGGGGLGSEAVGVRSRVEEVLLRIWEEVLGRSGLGVGESFFEVGGHSLLATRVVSRVREAFGVEVPLRSVFEEPTVAGLAGVIERRLAEEIEGLSEEEARRLTGPDDGKAAQERARARP